MTITAKIIEDSIADGYPRLTTFQLTYPRFIHSEFMTHRVFSRNAASSRAIPVPKMIDRVRNNPAMPIHWGKNQPGMQANEELDATLGKEIWLRARDNAVKEASKAHAAGYHKQIVNRLLEPFMHIDVVVTATNFSNFFHLRRHKDAQPEIKELANVMWDVYKRGTPKTLQPGQWHTPYVDEETRLNIMNYVPPERVFKQFNHYVEVSNRTLLELQCSAARCARVSYLNHDGEHTSIDNDLALYERLVGSVPLHASPIEHQASVDRRITGRVDCSGNLDRPWVQFRKILPGECVYTYDPDGVEEIVVG